MVELVTWPESDQPNRKIAIERSKNPAKKIIMAKVSTKFQNLECQFLIFAHSEHGVERTIERRFSIEKVMI